MSNTKIHIDSDILDFDIESQYVIRSPEVVIVYNLEPRIPFNKKLLTNYVNLILYFYCKC